MVIRLCHHLVVLRLSSILLALFSKVSAFKVGGLPVEPVSLGENGPFCFRVSSVADLAPRQNFLATQIWPASRVAAEMVERYLRPPLTLCELGCGPGAPSMMAAHKGIDVIATDLDELALELVQTAATEQGLTNVKTERVDLLGDYLPEADIYLLSDVFESVAVAQGAAGLLTGRAMDKRVWVFCQSDRAQRQAFIEALRPNNPDIKWISTEDYDQSNHWMLFDVEETNVRY